jgi:hypothetical protein
MDATLNILIAILCISGPLFFLTTVALGIALYVQQNKNRLSRETEQVNTEDRQKVLLEQKQVLDLKIQELENRINVLSKNAIADFCLNWCKEVEFASYSSEVEVEIKFVYLFMRFLGYGISDLRTRVPVEVPIGRQRVSGTADWVVYNHQQGKPFLVIEAKEPNQQLNNFVQDQARSYAFALSAPFYMLTNGKEVMVFERKIDDDVCVLALSVKDLPQGTGKYGILDRYCFTSRFTFGRHCCGLYLADFSTGKVTE